MDKVIKNKRGLELVTSRSSGHETSSEKFLNSFRKIPYFYILSGQVWWCNIKQFLSYSKYSICKLMQVNSWHKLSTSTGPFQPGKCGEEGEKTQKFKYLENEKSFFDEIKIIFHRLLKAIIWWGKIWSNIADTSFKNTCIYQGNFQVFNNIFWD